MNNSVAVSLIGRPDIARLFPALPSFRFTAQRRVRTQVLALPLFHRFSDTQTDRLLCVWLLPILWHFTFTISLLYHNGSIFRTIFTHQSSTNPDLLWNTICQTQNTISDTRIRIFRLAWDRSGSFAQICFYLIAIQIWIVSHDDSPFHQQCCCSCCQWSCKGSTCYRSVSASSLRSYDADSRRSKIRFWNLIIPRISSSGKGSIRHDSIIIRSN